MNLFPNESAMQSWLEEELDNCGDLSDLIVNSDILDSFKPNTLEELRVIDSFKATHKALSTNEIISTNSNISLEKPDKLKPDLLLYGAESQGVVAVELKNIPGPTREAGTELGAYAAEIKTHIPFLSDGDLHNVIISNEWPTLLRHYVFHEIFWQQRNFICLRPIKQGNRIRLEIVEIRELLEFNSAARISERHIAGYQLCLYDENLYEEPENRSRLDPHIEQMKSALAVMSVEGNKLNSHGFAFLWKDHWELSIAPYSISIFNMAPFESIERFLHEIEDLEDLTGFQRRLIELIKIQDPTGHGDSLHRISETGHSFLSTFCSPQYEGFSDWGALRYTMEGRAELLAFQGWGLFGDLFKDMLIQEYEAGNINTPVTCPKLGLRVVEDMIDENYQFIDPRHILCDEEDDAELFDDQIY